MQLNWDHMVALLFALLPCSKKVYVHFWAWQLSVELECSLCACVSSVQVPPKVQKCEVACEVNWRL